MSDLGSPWLVTERFASVGRHWWRQLDSVAHSERFLVSGPGVGIPSTPDDLISVEVSPAQDAKSLVVQGLGGGPLVAVVVQCGVGVELAVRDPSLQLGFGGEDGQGTVLAGKGGAPGSAGTARPIPVLPA